MFEEIKQSVLRVLGTIRLFSWCTVTGYDLATHTCAVVLHPDETPYPAVPILLPFRGMRMPHVSGMQGCCLLIAGEPQVLLGVTYTSGDQQPARGMTLEESLSVGGDLTLSGAFYPGIAPELPPVDPLYKYALVTVGERATGLPNARPAKIYACLPSADGTLHWVQIATAP